MNLSATLTSIRLPAVWPGLLAAVLGWLASAAGLVQPAAAQVGEPNVQAGLFYDPATEELFVQVRTTGDLSGETLTGAVLTLRYPTPEGTTFGTPTGPFGFTLQGSPQEDAFFTYLVYTTNQQTALTDLDGLGAEIEFARFPLTSGAGTTNQVELAPRGTAPQLADPDEFTFETDGVNFRDNFLDPYFASGTDLPVELTAFEATLDGQAVLLSWATASETNNAGFEVQARRGVPGEEEPGAALDAGAWNVLGFVEGHGTTSEAQVYAFRTADLAPGRHVFRLKQVDFDGAHAYSPEVEVAVELPEAYLLTPPYPNPFNPEARFTVAVRRPQHVEVAVYDALGRRVWTLHKGPMKAAQAHAFVFEAGTLGSGLYLIRAAGEDFVATRKAVLIK